MTGVNEGTASYEGIGSGNGWENTAAVSFTNIEYLVATSQIQNSLDILDGASIGTLIGGAAMIRLILRVQLRLLKALVAVMFLNMVGGVVTNRIDGNADVDIINGVFNPLGTTEDGSSDFINSWTRISVVNEASMPPVIIDPGGSGGGKNTTTWASLLAQNFQIPGITGGTVDTGGTRRNR